MRYLVYFLSIILLLSLNIGLFTHFKLFGTVPNLLLLFVVIMALKKDQDVLGVAILSGLFLDVYYAVFIGSFGVAFLIIGLLWYLFVSQILVNEMNWKYIVTGVVLALVFNNTLVWSYNAMALHLGWVSYSVDAAIMRKRFIPELIYNMLLIYPVYAFAQWSMWLANYQDRKRRLL